MHQARLREVSKIGKNIVNDVKRWGTFEPVRQTEVHAVGIEGLDLRQSTRQLLWAAADELRHDKH